MFKWLNNPLKHYQTIYVYNNAAVVHTVILDGIRHQSQASVDTSTFSGQASLGSDGIHDHNPIPTVVQH